MTNETEELRTRLNADTGKVRWTELERHFARGVLVKVAAELDLVSVAECMVQDDTARLEQWLRAGRVAPASPDDAKTWNGKNQEFWAVVTAPWVLVQEFNEVG